MTKRELLELCAKATGRTEYTWDEDVEGMSIIYDSPKSDLYWNPIDNDADCFRMETQMRVALVWLLDHPVVGAAIGQNFFAYEKFTDHADEGAARRWASCRAVAATVKP